MTTTNLSPQAEEDFRTAVLWWAAAFVGISLLPISAAAARSLGNALLVGGLSALAIWAARQAGTGDLRLPSRAGIAAYTLLIALATGALVVAVAQGVGDATGAAALPFLVGMSAAVAVVTPAAGFFAAPVPVTAGLGGLAALGAGVLIGEREALALLCQFVCSGAALGVAFASVLRRARELAAAEGVPNAGGREER